MVCLFTSPGHYSESFASIYARSLSIKMYSIGSVPLMLQINNSRRTILCCPVFFAMLQRFLHINKPTDRYEKACTHYRYHRPGRCLPGGVLLGKGYEVHGIKRRSSLFNTERIDHLYQDPHEKDLRLVLHHGDMTDSSSLLRIIQKVQPDEIYNLAAQSHVQVSFEEPEYTANSDALGALRILEAMRILGLEKKTRYYQASTSELFGKVQETPQTERTPFYPRSPYAVAKLYAYWITVNYREAYGMYACNGILFNHESPSRGETFVTRKITRALARIKLDLQDCLFLGNLNAKRDWGMRKITSRCSG